MFFSIALQHIFSHEDNIPQNLALQLKETQNLRRKIFLKNFFLIFFSMQYLLFLKDDIGQPLGLYEV
jgi:hypothetical protein